jgi:polyisoprenoid-binding protein YceI
MKMITRTSSVLALGFAFASAAAMAATLHAQQAVLDLDATETKVEFTLADVFHTVHGTFKLKSGSLQFDPATGDANGVLVVDATSGASGSSGRDRRMHRTILESAKFPEITFTADHFQGRLAGEGDSEIELHGMFGIHGAAHELVLKTAVHIHGDQLTASTRFVVPYVQWGMKNPSTLMLRVGDKVEIGMQVVGRVRPAP